MKDYKVAYILNGFPNISETFISDEIYSMIKEGINVSVYSHKCPKQGLAHPRAIEIIKQISVIYITERSRLEKIKTLIMRLIKKPKKTTIALYKLSKLKQGWWININALCLASKFESCKINHIHAHYADLPSQTALAISIWTDIPYTFTTHGYDVYKNPPINFHELIMSSKYMFSISKYNSEYIRNEYRVPKNKIRLVYTGIYQDFFSHKNKNKNKIPAILTVARLSAEKGHKFLLTALSELTHDEGLNFQLLLAGDGDERNKLEEMCKTLNIDNRVKFLGFQTQDQVRELLSSSDFFVLPSLDEALPVCLMEAMCSGLPVIAPNIKGIPELVIHKRTGLLFEPGNHLDLKNSIRWIVNNPTDRENIINNAKEAIVSDFDRIKNTRRIISLWESTLKNIDTA